MMRMMLYEAAQSMLVRSTKCSWLRGTRSVWFLPRQEARVGQSRLRGKNCRARGRAPITSAERQTG
jgi:hypothetical protein